MVKQRRGTGNRRRPARPRGAITRVALGVPMSQKRYPRDPPPLPHVIAYPVRVRFLLQAMNSTSQTGYDVQLSGVPTGANSIQLFYNLSTGAYTGACGLTLNELFVAAAMRIFGVDVTADRQSANYINTDYAIQKATFYGTENATYTTSGIELAIDFGNSIPGWVGRDSPGKNSRAVVSCKPPRLSWEKIDENRLVRSISLNTGTRNLPAFSSNISSGQRFPLGVFDATVLVRRSVLVDTGTTRDAGHTRTYFVDDDGVEITTRKP